MKNLSAEKLMDLICNAISYKFADDQTSPGLTISKLKNGIYYVSVVRYKSAFGKDKIVEFKAQSTLSLIDALNMLAKQIVDDGSQKRNPLDELRAQMSSL